MNTKKIVRLTETDLHNIIKKSVKRVMKEGFEDDFNDAQNNNNGYFGFEMKNQEGDWSYGEINFDPKSMTMSCMDATINVDPNMTVDQNLEALYEELTNIGYNDSDEY